nr:LysR substrate-binding domain-containing protein [Xanthomonas arboricola]
MRHQHADPGHARHDQRDIAERADRHHQTDMLAPPIHYLPTSTGFVEAAARGLGWCLAPESMAVPAVRDRQVVIIDPTRWLDVPLYWQCAAVRSSASQQLGQALRKAASARLR